MDLVVIMTPGSGHLKGRQGGCVRRCVHPHDRAMGCSSVRSGEEWSPSYQIRRLSVAKIPAKGNDNDASLLSQAAVCSVLYWVLRSRNSALQ